MIKNRLLISSIIISFAGIIGFMLPQHLGGVQKLQSIFILADEQLNLSTDCSPAAFGNLPQVTEITPAGCNSIIRARDVYDGISYTAARTAFDRDLRRDQIVFAVLSSMVTSLTILLAFWLSSLFNQARRSVLLTKASHNT